MKRGTFLKKSGMSSAVIAGAHKPEQSKQNAPSFEVSIPKSFWEELNQKKFIEANTPTPQTRNNFNY